MAQSKAFDSNAGQWPNFSDFKPLTPKSKEIRVLQFSFSSGATDMKFKMIHQNIETSHFAALSYSWGAPVRNVSLKRITIDGQVVYVRPVLHSFLQTLAAHDPSISLWIDAVCINQRDVDERNAQIAMMGEIFASAQKVYVWLGPGDDDTNYAFEHIEDIQSETQFDPRQFPSCCEKLFRMSYWTRTWVIQEFALARKLYIACGAYVVTWERLNEKINAKVLENDERALQVFELFQQLGDIGAKKNSTLLELMVGYQNARCIDRRDKAFALRGIAKDGPLLTPDYRESVADIYFRVLSQLQTADVYPKMRGFRWPHRAGNQLQKCLLVNKDDLLESLKNKSSDRLFATFEFVGTISSANDKIVFDNYLMFAKTVQLSAKRRVSQYGTFGFVPDHQGQTVTLLGDEHLKSGDLVYSLQTSSASPQGLYIAFRPGDTTASIVGMLLNDSDPDTPAEGNKRLLKMIGQTCHAGIVRCSRRATPKSLYNRVLCHISRHMMVLLWALDNGQERHLIDRYKSTSEKQYHEQFSCNCDTSTQNRHIEVFPPVLHRPDGDKWSASASPLWDSSPSTPTPWWHQYRPANNSPMFKPDFLRHGRTDMSYAAEEGLLTTMDRLFTLDPTSATTGDETVRTSLSWAASGGRPVAIQKLLHWAPDTARVTDHQRNLPFAWAIFSNNTSAVSAFLNSDAVDPNYLFQSPTPPLSHAVLSGNVEMVKLLLSSPKLDVSAEDSNLMSPLLWAATNGYTEIVGLLLRTKKVDVNKRNSTGRSPLSVAAGSGFVGIVRLLIADDGVDVDLLDHERWSPLDHAAKGGHGEICELLSRTGKVRKLRVG